MERDQALQAEKADPQKYFCDVFKSILEKGSISVTNLPTVELVDSFEYRNLLKEIKLLSYNAEQYTLQFYSVATKQVARKLYLPPEKTEEKKERK